MPLMFSRILPSCPAIESIDAEAGPRYIIFGVFDVRGTVLENPVSKKDAVLLLTRAISLYLIFWALTDVLALPVELNSFLHHLNERNQLPASVLVGESHARRVESYWMRYYLLELSTNVLRIVLWLLAAGWFYRFGPRIQKFFGVFTNQEEQSGPATVMNA